MPFLSDECLCLAALALIPPPGSTVAVSSMSLSEHSHVSWRQGWKHFMVLESYLTMTSSVCFTVLVCR